MNKFICNTCGVQTESVASAPEHCSTCTEERQYVSVKGQSWTTLEEMVQSTAYQNEISSEERGLSSITTVPSFAIGQTAYLVQGENFNIMWDCITYLDAQTIETIKALGESMPLPCPIPIIIRLKWNGLKLSMRQSIFTKTISNG